MTRSPDRWATVERLYHAALARPAGDRAAFLAEACAGDEALRRDVESLLAQPASADDILARGAVAAAAGLISRVSPATLTGQRIGAHQVLAPIGAGGMGEVYRARDTRLGREIAIKILPRALRPHYVFQPPRDGVRHLDPCIEMSRPYTPRLAGGTMPFRRRYTAICP